MGVFLRTSNEQQPLPMCSVFTLSYRLHRVRALSAARPTSRARLAHSLINMFTVNNFAYDHLIRVQLVGPYARLGLTLGPSMALSPDDLRVGLAILPVALGCGASRPILI